MIFLFEDVSKGINFSNCSDVNSSGIDRFRASPLVMNLLRFKNFNKEGLTSNIFDSIVRRHYYNKYIISCGVAHAPWDWCGCKDLDKQFPTRSDRYSVFFYVNESTLSDLRTKKAYLLFDQSHEGYHTEWLFEWFHYSLNYYNIPASQIIYVTGNLSVETQYLEWCNQHNIEEKICVIPHIEFQLFIYDAVNKQAHLLPSVDDHIEYKKENKSLIKTYNCFQKRPRPHRIWMFSKLFQSDLLDDGINSMNSFVLSNSYYEGKTLTPEEYNSFKDILPIYPRKNMKDRWKKAFESPIGALFEQDLYHDAVRDTWVSVVSEASFAEDTCFISEKSFKPIAARHPFIMCGNKNSLKYLRELGYRTFEGFIDESYDNLDTWDRYGAIINEIKKIQSMKFEEKINWFESMREILDHNYNTLIANSTDKIPSSMSKLKKYFGE